MTSLFQILCEALPIATVLLALPVLWRNRRFTANRSYLLLMTSAALALIAPLSLKLLPKWRIMPALPGVAAITSDRPPAPAATAPRVTAAVVRVKPPAGPPGPPPFSPDYHGWFRALAALWAAGMIAGIGRSVYHRRSLHRLIANSLPPDAVLDRTVQSCRHRLGIRRPVQVRIHPTYGAPVTWGVLHPVILLPAEEINWSASQRRIVLTHEMGHIKRHDALVGWIVQLLLIVYWFHPLAWRVARQAVLLRELACDDLVLRSGEDPGEYATHLGSAVLRAQAPASLPATAAAFAQAQAHPALQRIRRILDARCERRALRTHEILRASAPITLITLGLSSLGFKITSELQPLTPSWIAPPPNAPAFSVWNEFVQPAIAEVQPPSPAKPARPRANQPAPFAMPVPPTARVPESRRRDPIQAARREPRPLVRDQTEAPDQTVAAPFPSVPDPSPSARRVRPPASFANFPTAPTIRPGIFSTFLPAASPDHVAKTGHASLATGYAPGTTGPPAAAGEVGLVGSLSSQTMEATSGPVDSDSASLVASDPLMVSGLQIIASPFGYHLALTHVDVAGKPSPYVIEASSDLATWSSDPALFMEIDRVPLDEKEDLVTTALCHPLSFSSYRYLRITPAPESKE